MNKVELKTSWLDFLSSQDFSHAITFKPNDANFTKSVAALHRLFVKAHMLIQRRLIGRGFNLTQNRARQTPALGIVEGSLLTGHIHGAFKVAPEDWAKFEGLFAEEKRRGPDRNIWRTLVASGTCVVEPIYGAKGWHSYTLKDVWQTDDTDRVVMLPLSA
ncbi:hypothetical protein GRI75_06450 [Altererythrobacter soli]|uniref:Uncharacterized protein n=1 Tax=Croceibacterium soli TaxID=1739690 RepID=A0A6I4UU65_9SPHN|nr:hypothetical protein [Croceibacterium soli]MXP41279.1 hypothetical protein [Croceibacterium soli]